MSLDRWSLEVVRGKSVGRVYKLSGRESSLGNALNGSAGVDLSGEEGEGPRKMAGRQALIESTSDGLSIRDLDSPGGTFVNRLRVLPGQSKPLAAGDVIQIAGVQLKVVGAGSVTPAPTTAWTFSVGGSICKTWDEVLNVSAQRWSALREEITSGRAENFVRSIGRLDLIPPSAGTADERLDGWLALIPALKSKAPVLEVHPEHLSIKVVPGGGRTSRSIAITNVGYRLLRVTCRVESGLDWLKSSVGALTVVESGAIPIEVAIPEQINKPLVGSLAIESNGGAKSVKITLEAKQPAEAEPTRAAVLATPWLAGISRRSRMIYLPALAVIARAAAGLAGLIKGGGMIPGTSETPALFGPVVVFAALGGVLGLLASLRRREDPEGIVTHVISLSILGVFVASALVAASRFVEPWLGAIGRNPIGQGILWAGLGLAAAWVSLLLVPPTTKEPKP